MQLDGSVLSDTREMCKGGGLCECFLTGDCKGSRLCLWGWNTLRLTATWKLTQNRLREKIIMFLDQTQKRQLWGFIVIGATEENSQYLIILISTTKNLFVLLWTVATNLIMLWGTVCSLILSRCRNFFFTAVLDSLMVCLESDVTWFWSLFLVGGVS